MIGIFTSLLISLSSLSLFSSSCKVLEAFQGTTSISILYYTTLHYSAGHLYVLNHQSSTCRKRKYPRATCPMTPNRGGFSPMNCRAAGQVDLCVCVCVCEVAWKWSAVEKVWDDSCSDETAARHFKRSVDKEMFSGALVWSTDKTYRIAQCFLTWQLSRDGPL